MANTNVWDGQRFTVGQAVRMSSGPDMQHATPLVLVGSTGVVTKTNPVSVWMQFDRENPARVAGRLLKVSACNLEPSAS